MPISISTSPTETLTVGERQALITLLADEDPKVAEAVEEKIYSLGPSAGAWLKPCLLSDDPLLRRRVRNILEQQARHHEDNAFLGFCVRHGDDFDLEEGIWMLAKTRYPDINIQGYRALLDQFADELRTRIDFQSEPEDMLFQMNRYLFYVQKFRGNENDYYDSRNNYLNRVIDRRTGNPVNLSLIYQFVGRRLGMPIIGIAMPSHFLCRFQNASGDIYIDAFNRGKLLTKADCIQFLMRTNYGFQERFLAPASPRKILLRVCSNLHQIYTRRKNRVEAERLQRYMVAISK